MLTRTDRRRFPVLLAVIAALALAGAALGLLLAPVQAQEGSAPDKPRGLDATATHDSVTLTWDDPGDDSITGYVILRRIPGVDPEGHFDVLVADTGTDATTYTDDTVAAETRYTYRIKAINGAGTSERSRWYHIDVPAAPEPTPATPQRRSEYIDAHNAGVHDLAELMDGADPLDPDAWDTEEEEEDERVAGKPGKSVGTQQNRSSHTVDICDRTPEFEAALLAFIQATDSSVTCSTVTAAQLASVDYLYIEDGYGSGEIVPGDFANLTGLIELSISGSSELTTVPANAFSELRSLTNFENLGLSRNRIQSVHRDAFAGLTFSRQGSIDLRSNQIQTLEPGTFDGVTGLEFLNLSVNHIKAFEDGFFENLTGLKELTISNNPLRAIDRDTLRGLSSLQNLTIAGTPLSTLHPDAFDHLSALERLILQNNDIDELPAAIFADGPDSLREIRLSGNKIPSLDSETFANLTGLELLYLSSNELTALPANIFDSQGGSLTELYLGGNDFSSDSLPADVFDGLTSLERLYLHGSGLTSLDGGLFDGLTALQRLSLNNNDFSSDSLPADVFDGLSGLQWLYLYGSSLTSLDEDLFDGLTALQRLYLYDNGLTSLDEDLFDGLTALQWLLLSDNDFSSLPADVFEGLDDLQILYLHRAGPTSLDADLFEPLDDSLLYLYLHGNGLTSLDEDLFDGLTGLQRLYLHGNSLTSLHENVFDGLSSLQRLYLDGNALTSLHEDLFDGLTDLEDLNLDENSLAALEADVFDGLDDSLTDLYLRDNSLTALPTGVFDGLTGLQRLDLSCNALTALDLDELDPFAGTLKYLDLGANSLTTPPTEAAVNAKLTAVEALYLTGSRPCLPAFDTGLSALSLSTGTLTPAFVAPGIPGSSGYRADVGSDVSELTVTVAPQDPHASIEPASPSPGVIYDDDLETSGLQVHLDNRSTVRWQVRAENGAATQVYNVSVYREHPPGSVARLRSLELDGLTLTPEFSSITYVYAASGSVAETTVTAIPLDPDATIEYLDSSGNTLADADSTEDGHQVALDVGDTVFKVKVTAEDDTATQTYTVTVTRPASSDDCSADIATTCEVDVGGSAMGNIETADDKDYFRIDLVSDTKYQFDLEGDDTTRGNLGDPFLQLANSRGTVLGGTGNRDSGVGDNARVIWTPANIGNESVYLIVEGAARTTGTYTLSVIVLGANGASEADTDFPRNTTTSGRVDVGASATGNIADNADTDWFRVDLEAGKVYQIDMEGADTDRGTLTDPRLRLYEAGGVVYVATDRDGGDGKNARLTYAPATSARYFISASRGSAGGTYTLSVRDVTPPPDLPANTSTTGTVEVDGTAVRGDIYKPVFVERTGDDDVDGYDFDTDWFAVELEADRTYRIDMKGQILSSTGLGTPGEPVDPELTLSLPQINAIYDADGDYLFNTWSRDESDSHHLFRVTFHAHDDGTHYIAASGESHEWGGYELRVKDITPDDGDDTNPPAGGTDQRGLKNLRAVEEKGGVRLTWQSPDGAAVTGYRIERRRAGGQGSGPQRSHGQPRDHHTLVEDTGNTETSYVDESAEQGVEYEYRVTARNESGPGEESDWVRAGPASASNNPATGVPTISGTAQVGETLTADMSGIADADGLSGESFTYQWVSSDGTTATDIEKATGSTYTLIAADQGRSVKVRVTFTDDGGNEETLTSAPTEPVWGDGLPGAPRNLTATPGNKEITLSWDPPADTGNAPATRYRIEWRIDGKDYDRNDWGTSQETTYTTNAQANLANGVTYVFRVKAGNDNGNSYGPYGPASGEVSATPTSGSAVDLGTPVLSDTETLHHGMVRLDWQDIEDAGWYVVQYYHLEDEEWLDLPAEGVDIAFHGSSAVVSNLHGLSWLRVRAMSCAGASEWSQIEQLFGTNASDWEGVPVPEVEEGDQTEPCPVVLGTPVLSDTEYLHHGMVQLDWEDIEDAGWYVVQYYHLEDGEWLDLPAEGVDIAFHGSSAVVSNLHGLSWLRVGAASCDGASEWSQIEQLFGTDASDWEGVPVPEVAEGDEIEPCSEDADTPDNSPATGAPTISGTAQVGETLTANTSGIADADGLANATFSYQWLADDSDISGATNATYTLTDSEESKAITVQVSFTDDADNEETLTSTATDVVAGAQPTEPPAKPTGLEATASHDAVTLTWDNPGDDTITGYVILRRIPGVDPEGHFNVLVANTATAATTYTDDTVSAETRYTYRIKAINGAGTSERSRWSHIDTPAAPVPDKPTGLEATVSHGQVVLTWDDPGDESITGYVILRRVRENDTGGDFSVLVADTGTAALTYTDDTVAAGLTYTYRIKAINGYGPSERSRWVHIDTPEAP